MQKRHSGPQIVAKLRQAGILIGQGKMVPQVCKELEITQFTKHLRQLPVDADIQLNLLASELSIGEVA